MRLNVGLSDDVYDVSTVYNVINCCLCSNGESSPSQAVEVSGSESLKSDKYYLTSALPDGVLQQVEVTASDQFFLSV